MVVVLSNVCLVEFKEYPGLLKHVDIGPYGVWGIDKKEQIWKKTAASWEKVPGSLRTISVGKNSVWGTNLHDNIYMRAGGAKSWTKIEGKLKQV